MKTRSKLLTEIRPQILGARVTSLTSFEESFQNKTLRPIAKLQNDLLLEIFKDYIVKRKNIFHTLSKQKQLDYIEHAVKHDAKLRNIIKGVFIGLFSYDEFIDYQSESKALNKRITNLTIERLKDQLQYFDQAYAS
jgi:hypothetical protein